MEEKQARQLIKKYCLRVTPERIKILNLFNKNQSWTATQIHQQLPNIDLSTIYRNIKTLGNAGLLIETELSGKEAYYELKGIKHHAHLICPKCHVAICIPCPVKNINQCHSLVINQICPKCKK